jgi:hypothetical protein
MPDEALVRHAAQLVGEGHAPFMNVPLADPEDLFHPRAWITIGDKAWPSYSPVSFYAYGFLLRLGGFGRFLIMALPASAVAAFSAGVGNLLVGHRRFLALLAPLLAFPAFYWLLRPWVNMSPMLVGFAWAVFAWSRFSVTERSRWLWASALCVGFGAAVRPDCAGYAFPVFLLFCLARKPERWRIVFTTVLVSGALAVAVNLWLNHVITGHALRAALQIEDERKWGPAPSSNLPVIGALRSLFFPMGLPTLEWFVTCFRKYWLTMGPVAVLTVGQLGLWPLLRDRSTKSRLLVIAGVLLIATFCVSRMHYALFGFEFDFGECHHSVPRYLSAVYLLAALSPLLFVGRARQRWVVITGSVVLTLAAAFAGYEVWRGQSLAFHTIRNYVNEKEAALARIRSAMPQDAVVYTATDDKWLWSEYRLGTVSEPEPTAASIERAARAHMKVFILQSRSTQAFRRLAAALDRRHLRLVKIDGRRGIYAVQPSD